MIIENDFVVLLLRKSFDASIEMPRLDTYNGVYEAIIRNGILMNVYPVIKEMVEEKEDQNLKMLEQRLQQKYYSSIKQSITQDYEGKRVLEKLSGSGLDCIALKGWELRYLYPDITMRQMADLDILVRPYDYGKIKDILDDLGYESEKESSWKHDSFRKDSVHIEMHKRLTDSSSVIRNWENEMWTRTNKVSDHLLKMSIEDYYIFHFIHMHKDFKNGSLGLRRVVDTWLLQKLDVDMKIVESELDKMDMCLFHDKIVKLCKATMGEIPLDEDSEIMLQHAFKYGIYGSSKSYKAGRIASMGGDLRGGKIKSFVSAIFLPKSRMKAHFPIVEKYPVLLPFYWIKRIIQLLRGNILDHKKKLNYRDIDEEDYLYMKRFFKAGGIIQ
ncbi:MAG: nucleotidyltransferase family protein [Clostridia bacterium]|nr:nucleotidyltransferase family protein [Clostridia bacterium]